MKKIKKESSIIGIRINKEEKIKLEKEISKISNGSSFSSYCLYLIKKGVELEKKLKDINKIDKKQLDIYSKIR